MRMTSEVLNMLPYTYTTLKSGMFTVIIKLFQLIIPLPSIKIRYLQGKACLIMGAIFMASNAHLATTAICYNNNFLQHYKFSL